MLFRSAGVGELLARVGIVQVLPDGCHVLGDVEASVLLGHHLENRGETLVKQHQHIHLETNLIVSPPKKGKLCLIGDRSEKPSFIHTKEMGATSGQVRIASWSLS